MPRSRLLTEEHLPELRRALETQTLTALSVKYGVSISTMGAFLRNHGVLPEYDGWRPERYERLLAATMRQASVAETSALLATNTAEAQARLRQLIETIKSRGFTLSQLAIVTSVHRVYWRQYIAEGWLGTATGGRSMRVLLADLQDAVRARPELFDYRAVPLALARPFGLQELPDPPLFKLVTCRSGSIGARLVDVHADDGAKAVRFEVKSCGELGGLDLWAPVYAIPTCPRCGLRVSRFSEKGCYADQPGDSSPVRDAMAGKIGLRWRDGRFETPAGHVLDGKELALYIERLAQRNSREQARKQKLIADIERYEVVGQKPNL
jgi:hypothetical protein